MLVLSVIGVKSITIYIDTAVLAALSAFSLPEIPKGPGTQPKIVLKFFALRDGHSVKIILGSQFL